MKKTALIIIILLVSVSNVFASEYREGVYFLKGWGKTTHGEEKYTQLRVEEGERKGIKKQIFRLGPFDLNEGDIVKASAEWRTTNNTHKQYRKGRNVAMGSQLIISTDPDATFITDEADIVSGAVTEWNGFNVTRNMHHGYQPKSGSFLVESPGLYYVILVGRIQCTKEAKLRIDRGYGHLQVEVYGE